MKRRSFLASIIALFAVPFVGNIEASECCDECERDDDEVYDETECSCSPDCRWSCLE